MGIMGQKNSKNQSANKLRITNNRDNIKEFSSVVSFVHSPDYKLHRHSKDNSLKPIRRLSVGKTAIKKLINKAIKSTKKINREEDSLSLDTSTVYKIEIHLDRMSSLYTLSETDIKGIQKAWPKVEHHLLPIGIRMFISILESRCDKMPICKQRMCCNNSESKKTQCCPTQVMLNEELQKFVLLLMGIIRRSVKHIENQASVVKLLRKCSRKHFRKLNFDLSKLDADPLATHFCCSVKEIITHSKVWNQNIELCYINLIRMIVKAMQKLSPGNVTEYEEETEENEDDGQDFDDDDDEDDDELDSKLKDIPESAIFTTFDRRLVLYGCQTFQDFFEMHSDIMKKFDRFQDLFISDKLSVGEALKMHANKVLNLVQDIIKNAENQEKIRHLIQELGKHHREKGISEEHLDMLGTIICHTVRPIVFKSGLWSIEVEKSWNHLFEMVSSLMKRSYGAIPSSSSLRSRNLKPCFPSMTQIVMLKDTWSGIVEHMHELGLTAVVKLFKINYNFKFYTSPKVRYRPQMKSKDELEHLIIIFNLIISIVDQVIAALPTKVQTNNYRNGMQLNAPNVVLKQMDQLREPLDWIGPIFCNTVRPLLLVQGKWSYQVEMSWLMLFRQLVKKQNTTERLTRRERYS